MNINLICDQTLALDEHVHLSQTGCRVHCNNSDISETVQVRAVVAIDY